MKFADSVCADFVAAYADAAIKAVRRSTSANHRAAAEAAANAAAKLPAMQARYYERRAKYHQTKARNIV